MSRAKKLPRQLAADLAAMAAAHDAEYLVESAQGTDISSWPVDAQHAVLLAIAANAPPKARSQIAKAAKLLDVDPDNLIDKAIDLQKKAKKPDLKVVNGGAS